MKRRGDEEEDDDVFCGDGVGESFWVLFVLLPALLLL